ncbi:MAG: restriction endonuclease subunit S [Methanoregula sp.]|jgi:type I restriction enzyme S subunit|uniref:restriction endonuclease subunit S n=1 Tax=Methanoregula sp. TaxID=2052170 RepID=UPI0025E461F6|nr:restriction endonuclease subunit S [Methanoregula sp.]MCK9631366.1 restriction endonuclease subunit S [Methanoregula sp.]
MERELPEGWESVTLGSLEKKGEITFQNGFACGVNNQEGRGIPQLRPMNVSQSGRIVLDVLKFIETDRDVSNYCLQQNDVIFNNTNSAELVGKTAAWDGELEHCVLSNHMTIIRVINRSRLDPQFLARYLHSRWGKHYFENICQEHINQASVSLERLYEVEIPLPPLRIQRQIVAVLEQAEAVKRRRHEADALTGALLQSVFLEMFGDPVRNESGWEQSKLGNCCRVQRGKFTYRPRNEPRFYGGNYPFIQTGDVANCQGKLKKYTQTLNEEGLSISKMFPKGTIVISIAANIGDTAILDFDSCFPDSVVGISPDTRKGTVEFFEMMLRFYKEHLWNLAPETAQRNINLKILSKLDVIVPPLALQQQFARVVERVERIREQQVASGKEIEGLCEGLMARAFAGELVG